MVLVFNNVLFHGYEVTGPLGLDPNGESCLWLNHKIEANIFLSLIDYELNSLLSASNIVDCISDHTRLDLERYSLNISTCINNESKMIDENRSEVVK